MLDFAQARRMMVDCQLRTFDITSLAVLAAMDTVPRELFVPEGQDVLAYIDQNVPVGDSGQGPRFMLAPMFLGRMIQALDPRPGDRALDVACGLGYASAVLAELGADVTALESGEDLAQGAREHLAQVGAGDARVVVGPLNAGVAAHAPYHMILVNGAVEARPTRLLEQLHEDGRLICIEGTGRTAKAMLYVRSGDVFGGRAIFDAHAPLLPQFRVETGFVF